VSRSPNSSSFFWFSALPGYLDFTVAILNFLTENHSGHVYSCELSSKLEESKNKEKTPVYRLSLNSKSCEIWPWLYTNRGSVYNLGAYSFPSNFKGGICLVHNFGELADKRFEPAYNEQRKFLDQILGFFNSDTVTMRLPIMFLQLSETDNILSTEELFGTENSKKLDNSLTYSTCPIKDTYCISQALIEFINRL
jgi:hypothetical protein